MPARHIKGDVFLSHNRAQKDWTRELAIRLRAADFKVWFDEWSLRGGEVGSIGAVGSADLPIQISAISVNQWWVLLLSSSLRHYHPG